MSLTRVISISELRGASLEPECLEANTSPKELEGPGWEATGCYGLWTDDRLGDRCQACPACVWNWDGMHRRVRELLEGVVPW